MKMIWHTKSYGYSMDKKIVCFLIISLLCNKSIQVNAQFSEKLPATTIIGTEISLDFEDHSPSTTVNTIANVFDGDRETYFASFARSGSWVGLDLGEAHVITQIAYAPHKYFKEGPESLLLGIFEGANDPDFLDAVALFMITELAPTDSLTQQMIDCSKGFRYVRYKGPPGARCLIAEIEFYGYQGVGNNSRFQQLTNLPMVSIHTVEEEEITSKDFYVNGAISIIYNDGKSFFEDGLGIRGRGHYSWTGLPKKPYRIKLFNKVNLMGLPAKERNWTLIPNYGDKTLMRNLLAFELSRSLDLTYTSAAIPVDVILNGEYIGVYNLCDQMEVALGRIEVTAMTADDITPPNVTGGYFIEVDAYSTDEISTFISERKKTPVRIRHPSEDDLMEAQYNYIRDHYNKMESAIFAPDFKDPLNGYRKYVDVESFIRHFLVGEISGNTDTYWSTYMYKERDDDIFRFGPVWDLDLAYENDYRSYPINERSVWVYMIGSAATGFRDVINRLFEDEFLVEKLKSVYADYRRSGVLSKEAMLKEVDKYEAILAQSQQLNFRRWDIMNKLVHANPVLHGSYQGEVDNVRRYISDRIDWMDYRLSYFPQNNTPPLSDFTNIFVFAKDNTINFQYITAPVNVNIVDITGRVIVSKSISDNQSFSVSRGVYIIIITDTNGNQKVVKCSV